MPKRRIRNLNYYINTREAETERPHVHVGHGPTQSKKDMKIWLDTMSFARDPKGFKAQQVKDAMETTFAIRHLLLADYEKIHGKTVKRKNK